MSRVISEIGALVCRARAGDESAWAEIVSRFQDFAVALAIGSDGDWDGARDVAQEAFLVAFIRLHQLENPDAFPGWFATLVRTASGRRHRRRELPTHSSDVIGESRSHDHDDPAETLLITQQSVAVHRAVEALPEHERAVIALRYLADLDYANVAEFLGVAESTARKRAHSARRRLRELLTGTIEELVSARPSAGHRFRDELLLFRAIRSADAAAVQRLLARSPELIDSEERWSFEEAVAAGVGLAHRGTPLVRAVETGAVDVVDVLLSAGAAVDGRCHCAGAETPLWTAALFGYAEVVDRLLEAGADPNAPSFEKSTPMHAAGQRHPELMAALVAAGGDPERRDTSGRTPREWAELRRGPRLDRDTAAGEKQIVTGIRTVDLFAPLFRGSRHYWPGAVGVGQLVLAFAIADALHDTALWWVGFEHGGHYSRAGLLADSRELDVQAQIKLVGPGSSAARRERFVASIDQLTSKRGRKLVVCVTAPQHRHDVTVALQALSNGPGVQSVIVIEPLVAAAAAVEDGRFATQQTEIPEGFDTLLCFDAGLARAGRFPAVDPQTSATSRRLSRVHRATIARMRKALLAPRGEAADAVRDYLHQPLRIGEPFHGTPGQFTSFTAMLDEANTLLAGLDAV